MKRPFSASEAIEASKAGILFAGLLLFSGGVPAAHVVLDLSPAT